MSLEPTWSEAAARASGGGNWRAGSVIESIVSLDGREIPSEAALIAAKAEIAAEWAIAGTYLVEPENFRLATGATDQAAFANLLALLREAGAPPPSEIVIKDYLGQPHTITLERFRAIMLSYGMALYSAHAQG